MTDKEKERILKAFPGVDIGDKKAINIARLYD